MGRHTDTELYPLAAPPTPSDKLFGSVTGLGDMSRQFLIADIIGLVANIDSDRFFTVAGYDLTMQTLTILPEWSWLINGIQYSNPEEVEMTIPLAEEGFSRIDLIVANRNNTFQRIEGIEDDENPVAPPLPFGTLTATFLIVTENTISEPENPNNAYYYGVLPSRARLNIEEMFRTPTSGNMAIIQNTDLLELALHNGTSWDFFSLLNPDGGETPFRKLFIWNVGDEMSFAVDAGVNARNVFVNDVPVYSTQDVGLAIYNKWSQASAGAPVIISPDILFDNQSRIWITN